LPGIFFVNTECFPFALAVGAVGAAYVWAFIGFKAAPCEGIENILFCARYVTALIGVLDPEDEVACVAPGVEIVI
jgi:hypothetical protein